MVCRRVLSKTEAKPFGQEHWTFCRRRQFISLPDQRLGVGVAVLPAIQMEESANRLQAIRVQFQGSVQRSFGVCRAVQLQKDIAFAPPRDYTLRAAVAYLCQVGESRFPVPAFPV